jgi:hypothetical protein
MSYAGEKGSSEKTVTVSAIQGVTAPATGEIPVTRITANSQYGGTVTWYPDDSRFAPATQYTATINLEVNTGYTLQGIAANFFTVGGAESVSFNANSGVVTAIFPATAATTIRSAEIIIAAPVLGMTPSTTARSNADSFTGTVSWSPSDSPFLGDTVYTATVTLTAAEGFTFTGLETVTVNGQEVDVTNNGTTVTFSYTFAPTNTRTATGIEITSQPNNLTYTHLDTLNLTGLEVTLTYDTDETEIVSAENFTNKGITASPSHGNQLTHSMNNGAPVTVIYGNFNEPTDNLTVNKKVIDIQAIAGVTAPVYRAAPVRNIIPNEQYTGIVEWSPTVSGTFAPATVYTATITLTARDNYTLQGVTADYFTVAGTTSVSNSIDSGVITAVFPATVYNLGDTGPGGGKIFYYSAEGFTMTDDSTTCHYLEAAPANMPAQLAWASSGYDKTDIPGTGEAIGTGRKNTALILAKNGNAPAAKACNDYSNGEKTDWFLPSKDELNQLYINRASVGNMTNSVYWSSSQYDAQSSWIQFFSEESQHYNNKSQSFYIRAIRAF